MTKRHQGFTIVELLIVIVVVGILAAITIVAFNDIQIRASNAARANELRAWQKLFVIHNTVKDTYPSMPLATSEGYCLGKDFPNSKCRSYKQDISDPAAYGEVESIPLMDQLAPYGSFPNYGRTPVIDYIGPYVEYGPNDSTITLRTFLTGGNGTCQGLGLQHNYSPASSRYSICQIVLK